LKISNRGIDLVRKATVNASHFGVPISVKVPDKGDAVCQLLGQIWALTAGKDALDFSLLEASCLSMHI